MDKKILVIDDEHLIVMTVERALSKIGYCVVPATDRQSFLSRVNTGPFDLVIMDLNMADLTAEEIRGKVLGASPESKFLIMSGSNYDSPGFFIQKPFRIDDLRKLVGEILGVN